MPNQLNPTDLTRPQKDALLQLAWGSIRHGLEHGKSLPTADSSANFLQVPYASFVTLLKHGELRGCIGSLEAYRPLAEDIAANAFAAAFQDPRFAPVRASELAELTIHLSLLSRPESIKFESESDLLSQLRPSIDGLILQEGRKRGTFLPSVWEQLPDPKQFLANLKLKAGLPENYWSPSISVLRYETQVVE